MTKADKRERIILIAWVLFSPPSHTSDTDPLLHNRSEPLTFERADWVEIPSQSLIVVTPRNNLLKYPIVDQYFQHDAVSTRQEGFAASKGYRWGGHVPTPTTAVSIPAPSSAATATAA